MTLADESLKKRAGQLETGITTLFGSSGLKGTTVVADNKILLILTGSADKEKRPKLIEDAKKLAANWKGVTVINETEDAKPAEPKPDVIKERNAQIMSGVESILKDTDLKAVPAGNAKLTVFILGYDDPDVRSQALNRLYAYRDAWGIFDLVDKSMDGDYLSDTITHPWQLHYFHNDSDLDGLANPEQFVTGLNYLYGKQIVGPNGPGTRTFAEFKNATVWMNGTGRQVDQSRALLALFDSRSPVVNATAWAFQHAGPADKVRKSSEAANKEIKQAQWRSLDLAGVLVAAMANVEGGNKDPLIEILDMAGFETSIEQSLSLLQTLVRLGAHKDREKILVEADKIVRTRDYKGDLALKDGENAFKALFELLRDKDGDPSKDLQLTSDRTSILNFIERAVWFEVFTTLAREDERGVSSNAEYRSKPDLVQAPERLQGASESLDRHLDHLTKAFNDDLERLVTKPMLDRIRGATGVTALNGRVSVIVASGRSAGVTPELVSYSQTQTTRSLDETLFKLIAPPGSKTTTSTSTGTTTNEEGKSTQSGSKDQEVVVDTTGQGALAKLLAGMPLGQATLLAGLLGSANDERYVKVAPGVDLQIRPVVGPDHLSANVKISTKFGVETTLVKTSEADEGKFPLPDAVKSHAVSTVAPIPGFGYTELSTLDIQTLTPRPAASIPLLGQIPILGSIFRFPQSPAKTTHQSSILVSCTVTPRVLGLFQYYSGGASGSLGSRMSEDWQRLEEVLAKTDQTGLSFTKLKEILSGNKATLK